MTSLQYYVELVSRASELLGSSRIVHPLYSSWRALSADSSSLNEAVPVFSLERSHESRSQGSRPSEMISWESIKQERGLDV